MAQRAPLHDPAHRGGYERHRPEETVLYRTLDAHWPAFLERAEETGGLPRFVLREVEEYLRCGILEHGCVRVGCNRCGFERLVAFSCKRRGFCPSCLGRRMADTAVHLVERVIPEVPVRQWVCSLPWRLRVLLGYDRRLCAAVLEVFVIELSRSLKRRAKRSLGLATVAQARTGAVSVMHFVPSALRRPPWTPSTAWTPSNPVQRGDSGLRLNVHFHVLALDGVYVCEEPSALLVFHPLPAPTVDEVADVAKRTALRVKKILERHGRSLDGTGDLDTHDAQPSEQLALSACYGAAAAGLGLDGKRAGQPLLRVVDPGRARDAEPFAEVMGFNVHAEVAIPAHDRARLERLCRYMCRPPIAQERLEEHPSGKLRYAFKKPWKDGTVALLLEPMDLIARVCALVPPPRLHMVRYHGVLSSQAVVTLCILSSSLRNV